MKTFSIRSLAVAVVATATTLFARAELPEESWWQQDEGTLTINGRAYPMTTTLGLHVDGATFCGIAAFHALEENAWLVRGSVVDGRLVERSRTPIHAPALEAVRDEQVLQEVLSDVSPQQLDPPDFFVQPTALVSRHRTMHSPRGDFAIYEPVQEAPNVSLWLDLAWHCGDEAGVDKTAAAGSGEEALEVRRDK